MRLNNLTNLFSPKLIHLLSGSILMSSCLAFAHSDTPDPKVLDLKKASTEMAHSQTWQDFLMLADYIEDKGKRTAGAPQEKQMADWIVEQWQAQGLEVTRIPFDFELKNQALSSENLQVTFKGASDKTIVIGAHYDSVGDKNGSLGLIDNGSGVSALLTLAKKLSTQDLPYTVKLVAFGAEERGLKGSKAYVQQALKDPKQPALDKSIHQKIAFDNTIAMINLDTIIGGDYLYVHSAHSVPYDCKFLTNSNYNNDSHVREAIRSVSIDLYNDDAHRLHKPFKGYPEGETGSWSDHSPFACAGIPIAYIEATNFTIKGKRGNDGYSQVADKAYWTCLNEEKLTACNQFKERYWGEIWHTKFDRADALFPVMKERLQSQLEQNIDVLYQFLLKPGI